MILITRPITAAKHILSRIKGLGLKAKHYPLLEIKPEPFTLNSDYDYILISSSNALYALGTVSKKPAIVIGQKTAARVEQIGFNVEHIFTDSYEIIQKITGKIIKDARILYLSGNHISSDLDLKLKVMGYTLTRIVVYKSIAKTELPESILEAVDIIVFYSPRTAEIFASLNHSDLTDIIAICISSKTAQKLKGCNFKEIAVANAPNEEEIIKSIQNYNQHA